MKNETWRAATTALVVWMFIETAQAALVLGLGNSSMPAWTVAVSFSVHAVAWTCFTLGIRSLAHSLAPWPRSFRIGGHAAALISIAVADAWLRRAMTELLVAPPTISFGRTTLYYADTVTLSYLLALWTSRLIDAREALIAQARHEIALRAQLGRARLSYLHAQLQPHFLFNALGTVSELVFENPSAAIRTFRQLMEVLRAAGARDSAEIPLREEIEVLTPYLEVQRTRFSDWLEIDLRIDAATFDLLVPPLILQPLVENSIRHGLRGRSSRGRISVTAMVEADRLVLSVRDNGAGLKAAEGRLPRGGVGLSNTEERLRTLYGDNAALRLYDDEAGGAVAEVALPARRAEATSDSVELAKPPGEVAARHGFVERHPIAALVAGCIAASILWTQQSYAYLSISGRLGDTSVFDIARDDFVMVAMWAAMVPLAVFIARRVPLAGPRWLPASLLHAAALATVGVIHSVFAAMARNGGDPATWLNTFRGSMPVTMLIYIGAVAWSQRRVFEEWLAARQIEALRINAEITEARIAADSLSVKPDVLDFTLQELERYAVSEPLEAERVVTQLGTELRSRLEEVTMDRTADIPSRDSSPLGGEDRVERLAMGA